MFRRARFFYLLNEKYVFAQIKQVFTDIKLFFQINEVEIVLTPFITVIEFFIEGVKKLHNFIKDNRSWIFQSSHQLKPNSILYSSDFLVKSVQND